MTEHFDTASPVSAAPKRPLKVFPSTGSPVPAALVQAGHCLCHAHIIPLWDADRDPVHALYTRLTNDGVDTWLDKESLLHSCIISKSGKHPQNLRAPL